MIQRPQQGVLRDMWEFPMVEGDIEDLKTTYSIHCSGGVQLRPIRHSIMDQRITVTPWLFQAKGAFGKTPARSRWVPREQIDQIPTSSLIHKLALQLP